MKILGDHRQAGKVAVGGVGNLHVEAHQSYLSDTIKTKQILWRCHSDIVVNSHRPMRSADKTHLSSMTFRGFIAGSHLRKLNTEEDRCSLIDSIWGNYTHERVYSQGMYLVILVLM